MVSPGDTFMIPVYQRNYNWREDQISTLYKTLLFLAKPENQDKTHFIGTICFKSMAQKEHSIIDGQQRLTTTMLLIKAMHDTTDNEGFKETLHNNWLFNTQWGTPEHHRVKLHLNTADDRVFNILLENDRQGVDEHLSDRDKYSSHIYQNYVWFCAELAKQNTDEMVAIYNALERIIIIALDVENEDPQEIFESLNSTGLALTDVDKLRNYMLMRLDRDTQERLYTDYWFKIEQNVYGDDFIVDFFCDWLIYTKRSDALSVEGRRSHISQSTLYYAYKKFYGEMEGKQSIPENEITEQILKNMYSRSRIYRNLVFPSDIDFNKAKDETAKLYAIIKLLEAEKLRPLLLHILFLKDRNKINDDLELKLLDICLTYTMRSKVAGKSPNYQTAGLILQRFIATCRRPDGTEDFTNAEDALWAAIYQNDGKYALPNDQQFKDALVNDDLYKTLRSAKLKYLLYAIEQGGPARKGLPRYDDENISIEHVIPQTYGEGWIEYLEDDAETVDIYLTKLGNLALTTQNSELPNKLFDDKKPYYNNEPFHYTKELVAQPKWNSATIKKRSQTMANRALKIWNVPAAYQHSENPKQDIKNRRAAFAFSMIGLKPGDVVLYMDSANMPATVVDDKHVSYTDGKEYTLSGLAAAIQKKPKTAGVNGPEFFTYNGERLADIRKRMEDGILPTRRDRFKFSMAGLIVGDVISSTDKMNTFARVISDDKVEYEGKEYTLSGLTIMLTGKDVISGPEHFTFEGEKLSALRDRLENGDDEVEEVDENVDEQDDEDILTDTEDDLFNTLFG